MKIKLNVDELTTGQLFDFEERCGESFMTVAKAMSGGSLSNMSMKIVMAVIALAADQAGEPLSDEELRSVKITSLDLEIEGDDDEIPSDEGNVDGSGD